MVKINIPGGEPFLQPQFISEIIKYCKKLKLYSTGVICNGSRLTLKYVWGSIWISWVSASTTIPILRLGAVKRRAGFPPERYSKLQSRFPSNVIHGWVMSFRRWCHDRGIMFKLNIVVTKYNWQEDVNYGIKEIRPFRWKVWLTSIF